MLNVPYSRPHPRIGVVTCGYKSARLEQRAEVPRIVTPLPPARDKRRHHGGAVENGFIYCPVRWR